MTMIEIMDKVQHLIGNGYKLAAKGSAQEPITGDNVALYSGKYGTGYIVRTALAPDAQYHFYEIYIKGGDCVD